MTLTRTTDGGAAGPPTAAPPEVSAAEAPLTQAGVIDRMLAAVHEDPTDLVDVRVRAAMLGYTRGLREAVTALSALTDER